MQEPGYHDWNDALAESLFTAERADQRVYLFITQGVIESAGERFGAGLESFLAALRAGPAGLGSWGHCQRALHLASGWRDRGYTFPPYLGYLALFVLAAGYEGEGEFDPRSYYPRLWELLGEQREGTPASFDHMYELWDDLEQWSVRDMAGELGVFEARIVGERFHIGLPLAQTILTEAERHELPGIFASAGLEPGTPPSRRELLRALRVDGRHRLRHRTIDALARAPENFVAAVLDAASAEFLAWDGSLPDPDLAPGALPQLGVGLRITLALDRVAGRAIAGLRCRTTRDLPADGLSLARPGEAPTLSCSSYLPRWSALITAPADGDNTRQPYVPPPAAWQAGFTLKDATSGWTLRLRPTSIRIFVAGTDEQLPGLVEILELPRGRPFYVAFDGALDGTLGPWLETGCTGWRPIPIVSGLPDGWQFASADEALSDAAPRSVDEAIGFRDIRTLRLEGGIRASAGNTYFAFAPPRVTLNGADPGDQLLCNDLLLQPTAIGSGIFTLPANLPVDARIGLEVHSGDDVVKRLSLYLKSGVAWRIPGPIVTVDEFGHPSAAGTVAGALAPEPADAFRPDPLLTPGLLGRTARVYFVGRARGQVAVWPSEDVPSWPAVWAVPFGRRGKALYCGTSLDDAAPTSGGAIDAKQAKLWREVLWHRRERIRPPDDRALRALWREYQETARAQPR